MGFNKGMCNFKCKIGQKLLPLFSLYDAHCILQGWSQDEAAKITEAQGWM